MPKLNTLRVVRPSPQFCGGPPIVRPAALVGGLLHRRGLIRRGESDPSDEVGLPASRRHPP
jgi:hypothetical protein